MPDFTTILLHIIGCYDCKSNPELEKHLDTYRYFNNDDDENNEFNQRTLITLQHKISELATHVHEFV